MLTEVIDKIEQRGEERGMKEEARNTAIKMIERGFEIEEITEITGLSEEEIKEL